MMISISLPFLIGYSLAVSAALIWLNLRGEGMLGAAGGTLVVCIAIAVIQSLAFGSVPQTRQAVQYWGLFVLLPSAVVFAVSRAGILRTHPWSLLLLGPLTFVVAVTTVMVTYNILFASARSQ
jgi:hypothetical protein